MYIIIICLMIAVALLFLLMIPITFFFGLIGMSIKAIWGIFLFVVKYGAPAGLIGALIAKIREKNNGFEFWDYLKHIGIAAVIGVAAMLVGLQFTQDPGLPAPEDTTAMVVSYDNTLGEFRQEAWEQYQIDSMCESLTGLTLKRTVKEFMNIPEDKTPYDVCFTLSDGSQIRCTLHSTEYLTVHKGLFPRHYKVKEDGGEIPYYSAEDIFYQAERIKANALWEPFAEEFCQYLEYDQNDGKFYIWIPEEIPGDSYRIHIEMTGVQIMEDGYENHVTITPFEQEQKYSTWDPGNYYRFALPDAYIDRFTFIIDADYYDGCEYDALHLLPEEYLYSAYKESQ